MDPKSHSRLELDKILKQLAGYASFSASRALLEALEPTADLEEARRRIAETSEARLLLEEREAVSIGGARDVRPYVSGAVRGVTLTAEQLLEIKATLQAAAALKRTLEKVADRFPLLARIASGLDEGRRVVAAIAQVLDDEGQVLDSASPRLAQIRHDLHLAHSRLQSRLQAILNSGRYAPYLQEALVTLREGRYVIPVKAEARGRVRGIVHDQSSSGATLFIEPLETVEINNEIRELQLAEQNEILRILREVSALVGEHAEAICQTVEALAALDAAFARARYANALRASAPQLVDFDPARFPGSTVRLYRARHPLIDPQQVVPIDVELDPETYVLIITGPNTGGKTVALKTVGLLTLMAQCGLHIPAAEGSMLSVFNAVYADIGDEQSIEQSLSTFSAHLMHIIHILQQADERSLVILDELGAGTDPTEGAALARAILDELCQRGATTFVATHYPELKLYAHSMPGVRNASVEFDLETLSPTYRLIVGLPGRSNALAIAERLGLSSSIIERARGYVGVQDLHADDLLEEIHRTREEIRQTQARLLHTEAELNRQRDELRARLDNIEEERRAILEAARAEAHAELEALREEVRELRRRLRAIPPTYLEGTDLYEQVNHIEEESARLSSLLETSAAQAASLQPSEDIEGQQRVLQVGDRVYVPRLHTEGEVVALPNGDEVEVQVGQFRVRVEAAALEVRPRPQRREEAHYERGGVSIPRTESPGLELHLRGMTLEEGLPRLEEYLDRAYMAGLPWVRIVHGKGTGTMRKAVRDLLRHHPLVREFKSAPANEGGEGVTIAYFVPLG